MAAMVFVWPYFLLGLAVVGAVALWTLFRPNRQVLAVGSLRLWQQAVDRLDPAHRRRSRRVSLSWAMLLLGAAAAGVAAANPLYLAARPARHVAISPILSAELAEPADAARLRQAAGALLARLDNGDRVDLLLPDAQGGRASGLSVAEARERIAALQPLAAPAGELASVGPQDLQHVYYFVPAGAIAPKGPTVSTVPIGASPSPTIESLAAAAVAGDNVQVLIRVFLPAPQPNLSLRLLVLAADGSTTVAKDLPLPASPGLHTLIEEIPQPPALAVQLVADGKPIASPGAAACLARRTVKPLKVALVGDDHPMLRRFVRIHPAMQLVARPQDAQLVLANRASAPAGVAALVFNPPQEPPGFRRDKPAGPVLLRDLLVDSQDAVMKDVDLSAVAIHRLAVWVGGDESFDALTVLARLGDDAVIVRTPDDGPGPRRIYVAFDLAQRNTNFSLTPSFVVFLANSVNWLGGQVQAAGLVRYESLPPLEFAATAGTTPLWTAWPPDAAPQPASGIYAGRDRTLHAVSLTGLRKLPAKDDPLPKVAALPLPAPRLTHGQLPLWPYLLAAAGGLWLAGWAIRLRE